MVPDVQIEIDQSRDGGWSLEKAGEGVIPERKQT
jgi:hypothetical protein